MKFYVIATPIGNLEDITFRAVKTLKEVDLILCEDTRTTKKLLQRYEINKPTLSYHQHSKISKIEKIFDLIKEGKTLALVSDAGTPTISDPGSFLISQIREEFKEDVEIIAIPGASALISALLVGILLVLMPSIKIPNSWKTILLIVSGVVLIFKSLNNI